MAPHQGFEVFLKCFLHPNRELSSCVKDAVGSCPKKEVKREIKRPLTYGATAPQESIGGCIDPVSGWDEARLSQWDVYLLSAAEPASSSVELEIYSTRKIKQNARKTFAY
ncbi:hypothetical protein TNIN_370011 [Trichonephila inaurata madagascariensis]|uniref:Uncharacterized protein n=1 Tax=Trichonephila inaurata madagascariensis TaxID=2747483 RepID=A0A8X6X7K3_9ARAC|nr:hypothetical protein TNIN_370011 [Trichonephila inaurata madagascariensis]